MRAHQLSPENAKSIRPKTCLVGVPIRCRCIAPVREDRYQHHTVPVRVTVNGLLIEDAEIDVISYVENDRYAKIEFTGTIAIFSPGILPAVEAAKLPDIKFSGWVEGQARELKINITGEVVMLSSIGGITPSVRHVRWAAVVANGHHRDGQLHPVRLHGGRAATVGLIGTCLLGGGGAIGRVWWPNEASFDRARTPKYAGSRHRIVG